MLWSELLNASLGGKKVASPGEPKVILFVSPFPCRVSFPSLVSWNYRFKKNKEFDKK
jgi:hypothetical protein